MKSAYALAFYAGLSVACQRDSSKNAQLPMSDLEQKASKRISFSSKQFKPGNGNTVQRRLVEHLLESDIPRTEKVVMRRFEIHPQSKFEDIVKGSLPENVYIWNIGNTTVTYSEGAQRVLDDEVISLPPELAFVSPELDVRDVALDGIARGRYSFGKNGHVYFRGEENPFHWRRMDAISRFERFTINASEVGVPYFIDEDISRVNKAYHDGCWKLEDFIRKRR